MNWNYAVILLRGNNDTVFVEGYPTEDLARAAATTLATSNPGTTYGVVALFATYASTTQTALSVTSTANQQVLADVAVFVAQQEQAVPVQPVFGNP